MEFLGMTVTEWLALTGIITFVSTVLGWIVRRGYRILKNDIVKPLKNSIDELASALRTEKKWIHERHGEVVQRLDGHEKKLERHDDKLIVHEERIKTLFNNQKN